MLAPWILRNHTLGAGWRIDGISADRLKHEAAAVQARAENQSLDELRNQYMADMNREFAEHPELYQSPDSRFSWQENAMKKILLQYPFHFLFMHFQPLILLPDIPAFLENLGITVHGRNTLDIINREGILAGALHYFRGNWGPFLVTLPLLILTVFCDLLAVSAVIWMLLKRKFLAILVFLLFAGYYLIIPGILPLPRFHLCVLPYFSVLAAWGIYIVMGRSNEIKLFQFQCDP